MGRRQERAMARFDTESDAEMAAAAIVAGIHLHEAPHDPAARDELVLWVLRRFARDGAAG
jgi:hypothetical protein